MFLRTFFVVILLGLLGIFPDHSIAQKTEAFNLARIKYRGGGDWYNDPSSLKNLAEYSQRHIPIAINPNYDDIPIGSPDIFDYPFAFLTGHGAITINQTEVANIRAYLENGGFLYIDDDYGLDEHFRKTIKKIFPDEELVEIPFDHPIYHQVFDFPNGLPKIHKHDGKPPKGFGLFRDGQLVLFYTYETNLADGWANPDVHKDPEAVRQKALQMGTNILVYALTYGR
ncbi:DUF4159 domain-containing protein [Fodinibius saliphilus]|uniref:DUF4159 domain-containing protein n=1 Tax=Fodinibius saliphilus TaxID=1920650 RepID=UPI00110950DC|nr:DUF4159 domain-containing protein [Fodinibius saliphilus]